MRTGGTRARESGAGVSRSGRSLLILAAGVLVGLACGFAIGLTKPRARA